MSPLVHKPPPTLIMESSYLNAKTIAIVSALCKSYQGLQFQTASGSVVIAPPRGDHWLVMVVTRKCHDPAHKSFTRFAYC